MNQDDASVAAGAVRATAAPDAAPAPTEIVERPAAGLARGRWEAPPWAFTLVAAATVLAGLVWLVLSIRGRRGAS